MVVDLTSSPIKKDIDQGSDNDLRKEDEVCFFRFLFPLHTQAVLLTAKYTFFAVHFQKISIHLCPNLFH